ncbi:MAG: Cof-type HAD-IIB family hydrolase [Candidatus Dormibacteraeota bacterium]|nr:Cof-type HAD-IIB family hydrolase [Candidatus Dormibacteraeota bacterium]
MRYLALATDYDGTLATDGAVDRETVAALQRLAGSGRKLLLVTGRQLSDLLRVFPEAMLFDAVVAENGGVLYRPATSETLVLAPPPPSPFVEALQRRGVAPIWVGQVVVATVQPNETAVVDVIKELGLELQVILNKGSVMVLPASVDKATGLRAALEQLALSPQAVVGLGDAENDQAFLAMCGCGVAVANALDALKAGAKYVTRGEAGAGVREVIAELIAEDRCEGDPNSQPVRPDAT